MTSEGHSGQLLAVWTLAALLLMVSGFDVAGGGSALRSMFHKAWAPALAGACIVVVHRAPWFGVPWRGEHILLTPGERVAFLVVPAGVPVLVSGLEPRYATPLVLWIGAVAGSAVRSSVLRARLHHVLVPAGLGVYSVLLATARFDIGALVWGVSTLLLVRRRMSRVQRRCVAVASLVPLIWALYQVAWIGVWSTPQIHPYVLFGVGIVAYAGALAVLAESPGGGAGPQDAGSGDPAPADDGSFGADCGVPPPEIPRRMVDGAIFARGALAAVIVAVSMYLTFVVLAY